MTAQGASPAKAAVEGEVAPGWERVARAFDDVLAAPGEVGASLCVRHRGDVVVDLAGGHADGARSRAFGRDTLCMPYSVSKAMVAFCAMVLVDREALDLEAPVASVWPGFAAKGKQAITVRQVLCHQAGVTAVDEPLAAEDVLDWDRIVTALEQATPRFAPGTAHGESARFYGHLVGEVVRRIDGRDLGTFFREEVAAPLGIDFHFGLDARLRARCADMLGFDDGALREMARTRTPLLAESWDNPPGLVDPDFINGDAFRAALVPAINGHGSARGVARFHALLAGGGALEGTRLVSPSTIDAMLEVQRDEVDLVFGERAPWALGVQSDAHGSFGMGGLGGHLGCGHRAHQMAFGFVKNRLGVEDRDEPLLVAVARCVAEVTASG